MLPQPAILDYTGTPAPTECRCLCNLQDPFAEKTVYNDNAIDKFFIKLYSQKMADQLTGAPYGGEAGAVLRG
jgi:hypothetical protein